MTFRTLLIAAPVRAVLVLLAIGVVLGPMLLVASLWGVDASVAVIPPTLLLVVIVIGAVVLAFFAGATIAFVAKIGANVHVHAAIVIPHRDGDV